MTVVAFLPDVGIVVSDLLLSVDVPGGPPVQLPTVGSTRYLTSLSLSPTSLVRKIHRLKHGREEVVMFVAGTVSHLRKLIDNFDGIRTGRLHLAGELSARLNVSDPLSILALASDLTDSGGCPEFEYIAFHKGRWLDTRYDANRRLSFSPYFGRTILAGSGAPALYRWLCERGGQYLDHPLIVGESDLEKYIRIQNLIPSLMLEEDTLESLRTINNGVGGYYESFELDMDGLHPQDSVLTVFAAVGFRGKSVYLQLRRMFFHLYAGDWLFIISLSGTPRELSVGHVLRLDMSEFQLFKIKPLLQDGAAPNWNVSRLAVQLPTAEHWRLTLYRGGTDTETFQLKRFSQRRGAEKPLFTIAVKNHIVSLSLEQQQLDRYLAKFPANPSAGFVLTT